MPRVLGLLDAGRQRRTLAALLILGFSLRVAAILWGTPLVPYHTQFHPDEPKAYKITAGFPENYLTHDRFPAYGSTVAYPVGAALFPVKLLLTRGLNRPDAFFTLAWLASRLASVLYGTATIWLTYLVGCALFSAGVALAAAALVSVSFYHVMNSALATLDVPMSFWLMANVLLCARALARPRLSAYVALGASSAMFLGTKLSGAPWLAVPVLLTLWRVPQAATGAAGRAAPLRRRIAWIAAYLATTAVVFSVFHPHLFLAPERYLRFYEEEKSYWMDPHRGQWAAIPGRLLLATVKAGGWWLPPLAAIGALLARRRWRAYQLALIGFVLVYYGIWRWYVAPRYLIPLLPLLCLWAALACARLMEDRRPWLTRAGQGLLAACVLTSLAACLAGLWARFHDTRPPAARYLAETLRPGTTVGFSSVSEVYPWTRHRWRFPTVDLIRVREVPLTEQPEVVITSSHELGQMAAALRSEHLLPGYHWDPAFTSIWYRHEAPSPALFRFYEALLADDGPYVLERRFRARTLVPLEVPPPEIRIYRKRSGAEESALPRPDAGGL
jgi:MFS family permease